VFVNLGVVPNRHYRGADDRYLLRLDGTYKLKETSTALIRRHFPNTRFTLPVLQTVAAQDSAWRNNFSRGDLSVLDPASIERSARLFQLDEAGVTEAVALHEAQHDLLAQALKGRKSAVITPLLEEISATTDNILRFHHWLEVDEFLADAMQVLSRSARKRPHDASALFLYRLLLRHEANQEKAGQELTERVKINSVRKSLAAHYTPGKPLARQWIEDVWLPYIDATFTDEVEHYIRDRYRLVLERTLTLLQQDTAEPRLTAQ